MNLSFGRAELICLAFIMMIFITETIADFEVCNPGTSTAVYQFIRENCPFGVLFDHPITVTCLASTNYPYVKECQLTISTSALISLRNQKSNISLYS